MCNMGYVGQATLLTILLALKSFQYLEKTKLKLKAMQAYGKHSVGEHQIG